MTLIDLFINNLLTIPIFAFVIGILTSVAKFKLSFNGRIISFLTFTLLFSIGLKGGTSLIQHSSYGIFSMLGLLIAWGLIQPFLSYMILKKFTKLDSATAAAVAACFGSISVMTYIAGATFLDKLDVGYDGLVVAALAVMEVPAIISGLYIFKLFNNTNNAKQNLLKEAIFNKTVLTIIMGMIIGIVLKFFHLERASSTILILFKPFLCVFLFYMGFIVGKHRENFRQFSLSLSLFGLYMPLLGGGVGLFLSYLLGFDVGTGTLVAILTASASYIAVPAAMRVSLPQAQEAIYLPLSLGITFPFNVMVGIPIYYRAASIFLI